MAEEEVTAEIEAVQSVYGDDCTVFQAYPPHLTVHVTPRTADVESQQFVEAVLRIQAGPQYPEEPPHIQIIDSKGLDEQRQKHLVSSIQDKAWELSSCFMLVALCEEAVEKLTSMNHPDGDCPLCLYPLLNKEAGDAKSSFMKLMSCFHCFHRECIIRWWNWIQSNKECESAGLSGSAGHRSRGLLCQQAAKESTGSCPVCRKVFHAKDIEHVLDMVGAYDQLSSNEAKVDDIILQSESERIRREKFEATIKVQQEKSGLNGCKETEVLRPSMFIQQPTPQNPATSDQETAKQQFAGPRPQLGSNSSNFQNRASTSDYRNKGTRKHGGSNSKKQVKQWVKKENGN